VELILASASPRRRTLLASTGLSFEVVPSTFDERSVRGLSSLLQARAAARGKAEEVAARRPDACVIGADTVVALDNEVFGQPRSDQDAARMLRALSGRVHSVVSAVCVLSSDGRHAERHAISRVAVAPLSPLHISRYLDSGEPMGKAGGYAIQGEASKFCTVVRGSINTVIGLPLHVLRRLLRQLDFSEAPLW
jgi:septum formation protein